MCRKKVLIPYLIAMLVQVILIAYKEPFLLSLIFNLQLFLTEASFIENEYPKFHEKCKKLIGKSFPGIAANAKKLGLRDINGEVQIAIKDMHVGHAN